MHGRQGDRSDHPDAAGGYAESRRGVRNSIASAERGHEREYRQIVPRASSDQNLQVRANSVFPVLIPTLIAQPITAFNARALGALVKVAGTALHRRLDTVLGALVTALETQKSEDIRAELQSAIEALLSAVTDGDGVHQLEMLLIGW